MRDQLSEWSPGYNTRCVAWPLCSTYCASTGGMVSRPSDCISGTVFGYYPVSRTHNQPRTECLPCWHDTPGIFKVMRSAFPSFFARVLPPSRVLYVFNTLLDRCVSGLLYCTTIVQMLCTLQTRSLNLSTNPVQLSSHNDVAKSTRSRTLREPLS